MEPDQEMSAAPFPTGCDGPPEPEPVTRRNVVLCDRDEAREARLGGKQVIAVGIERSVRCAPNGKQPALLIEQEAELHTFGHPARRRFDQRQTLLQTLRRTLRLHDIPAPTLHGALRGFAPEEQIAAPVLAPLALQRSDDVGQRCRERNQSRQANRHVRGLGLGAVERGVECSDRFIDMIP